MSLSRRFIQSYQQNIRSFLDQVQLSDTVRESDLNTLIVGMAVGYTASIPATPYESAEDYYIQNCHRRFEDMIEKTNEALVLDFEMCLDIAKKIAIMRYVMVHEPMDQRSVNAALYVAENSDFDLSQFQRNVLGSVKNHTRLLTIIRELQNQFPYGDEQAQTQAIEA